MFNISCFRILLLRMGNDRWRKCPFKSANTGVCCTVSPLRDATPVLKIFSNRIKLSPSMKNMRVYILSQLRCWQRLIHEKLMSNWKRRWTICSYKLSQLLGQIIMAIGFNDWTKQKGFLALSTKILQRELDEPTYDTKIGIQKDTGKTNSTSSKNQPNLSFPM